MTDNEIQSGTKTDIGTFTLSAGTYFIFVKAYFASNNTGRRISFVTSSTNPTGESHGLSNGASVNATDGASTVFSYYLTVSPSAETTYHIVNYQNSGTALNSNARYMYIKVA